MFKLKLQYFGHIMQRTDSIVKTLMLRRLKVGGEGDDKGWDGWMASLTQWAWVWINSRSSWWTEKLGVLQSMGSQWVRHDWATELNWLKRYITYYICVYTFKLVYNTLGFPGDSNGKESACNMGIPSLISGLGRSPGERNGYPLQYSGLENPMDRGAWRATGQGVTKSQMQHILKSSLASVRCLPRRPYGVFSFSSLS